MSGKCCCRHPDARQCFLLRHPECRRASDTPDHRYSLYDEAMDCECECYCHIEADGNELDDDEEF